MSKSVWCRQVQTKVEMFFKQGRQRISITFVCILQIDDAVVVAWIELIVRSCRCFISSYSIYLVTTLSQCQIFKEYIVHGLWVDTFQCHLYITRQSLLQCKVHTKYLRVFEVLVYSYNVWFCRSTALWISCSQRIVCIFSQFRCVVSVVSVCIFWSNCGSFAFHTSVIESIRQPYERYTSCEDTDTTAEQCVMWIISVPTETYTRWEQDFCTRILTYTCVQILWFSKLVECIVCSRIIEDNRNVDTQTVCQIEVVIDIPFVLCIESELTRLHGRSPFGVTTCKVWISVLISIFIRSVCNEIFQWIIVPWTVRSLDEKVCHLVDFIVCTECQSMITQIPWKVIFECVDVLIQVISSRRIFRTDVGSDVCSVRCRNIADLHSWSLVCYITVVTNEAGRSTELVVQILSQMRS